MADPSNVTEWTQNDTWPPLRLQLADENGVRADLEDSELIIFRAKQIGGAQTISGTAIPMVGGPDNEGFNATYTWKASDLAVPGSYQIEAKVTWDSGTTPPQAESWSSSVGDLPTLVVRAALG